nr:glycerophosphodiester phosphodiesterase family protein [Flexivirga oryzae]
MAHRGFSSGDQVLENSLAAFGAAVDLGYRYVETDVHATSDGTLIAFHDDRLDRVTDRSGAIGALPWSTVREAKIGGTQEIPTLDALLESWPELRINIDCKTAAAVEPLAEVIERHAAHDRVCVASFSDRRRRAVLRRLSRPVATSGGQSVIARFVLGGRVPARARVPLGERALRDVDCLQVPVAAGRLRVVSAATLRRAHHAGVQIHVWTIDDADQIRQLLDLGVDGIMTDRADILREVLVERGEWAD